VSGWYRFAGPLLRLLPTETAHGLALRALAWGLVPAARRPPATALRTSEWGLDFASPIGLAAGFDKDGVAVEGLLALGFGFVEVGTVTPAPQPGNPRPRLFRLAGDEAIINRLGFNSQGLEAVAASLNPHRDHAGVVGANIGVNRDSDDTTADYLAGLGALHDRVDYLAINVSSPNTPGLRALQGRTALGALIGALMARRADLTPPGRRPLPILVKIAPDLDERGKAEIAEVALASGLDGLIVGNTTLARDGLTGRYRGEAGGLSGRPLFARSTALLAEMYRLTGGRIPLIGVGGVSGGGDAYAKIRAGASLVQLYTALIYRGPGLVARINHDLARRLAADGFASVADAVGVNTR
jgi:dihydroorotate dehydrogenase